MSLKVIRTPADVTPVPSAAPGDRQPLYVCVGGASGAGKSTILGWVADVVAGLRRNVVVIDEKATHHPYLDQLFRAPNRYAFELQLQFMVNRLLFAKRWLTAGYSTIIERSHLEDPVFIRHLLALGHVADTEHDVYMDLWDSLQSRAPRPDALLFLEADPEVSIERLSKPSAAAERPSFPDEATRNMWIRSWHELYAERVAELAASEYASVMRRCETPLEREEIITFLRQTLRP